MIRSYKSELKYENIALIDANNGRIMGGLEVGSN